MLSPTSDPQYAEAINKELKSGVSQKAKALAAEAVNGFWKPVAQYGLPRSLDRATYLPNKSPGPNFYSSTLGGPELMLSLLNIYKDDKKGGGEGDGPLLVQ